MVDSVSLMLYGPSKVGKSTLAATAPKPLLHLDAEGGLGTKWLKAKKIEWNPINEPPPEADGSWEICVVHVRNYQVVQAVYDYLNDKPHPFRTLVLDSISEIQQRCIDHYVGRAAIKIQDWGTLLRELSDLVRKLRDLGSHPVTPLECLVIIAMTRSVDSVQVPLIQGQLADRMPYWLDICAFLSEQQNETTGAMDRYLLVGTHPLYKTGERVGWTETHGRVVVNPNLSDFLDKLFEREDAEKELVPTSAETN